MVQNYQKTSEVGLYLYVYPYNHCIFEWLSDQNGYTDDTICTVAVADALLHGRDFGESIHDWCNRYPHPMGGYGGRFAQWVHSENPLPYNSFGNGSAMRVSPVLLMAAVPQIPYFTHASCIWLLLSRMNYVSIPEECHLGQYLHQCQSSTWAIHCKVYR